MLVVFFEYNQNNLLKNMKIDTLGQFLAQGALYICGIILKKDYAEKTQL